MEKENFYFGKPAFINSNESLNLELEDEKCSQSYFWDVSEESDNVEDLENLIQKIEMPLTLKNNEQESDFSFEIKEEDFLMKHFFDLNSTFQTEESVECIVTHVSNLERFPMIGRTNTAKLPCIFAWFDVNSIFESEYSSIVQSYFRQYYKNLQNNTKIYFSIAASCEKMKNLKSIQREIVTGRVMFHYIGFGFPNINEKGIWCGERRLNEFGQFSFKDLFSCIGQPSFFIFDCNNAAIAIEQFKLIEKESGHPNNWLCICSSGIGEELPSDPRLPKDFFTSVLFTPLKLAVICHLLRYYHLNNTTSKFITDPPFQHLWSEKSQEAAKLNLLLTAIEDSIAIDCLPKDLYTKLFQKDKFIASVFRAFLFSQFLLKYFRITGHSHPEIPNTASHHLWRRWVVILDSYISCNNSIPRFSYVNEFFSLVSKSFKIILENNQFQYVHPYYPTLLYYMILNNTSDDNQYFLLYQYCINKNSNSNIISPNLIFNNLLVKIISKDPKSQLFSPFCYLIVYLIRYNPLMISEFRKEIDVSNFTMYIFNHDLSIKVRTICAVIIASFVVCHEQFQQICSSQEYLDKIRKELEENENSTFVSWLLLIIKRVFYLYTPEVSFFSSNGLHIQCELLLNSYSQAVRAAAISVLTCFMRPFNSKISNQLFFLALSCYSDPSYLVRFHFILLIKKFIFSFDNFDIDAVKNFTDSSFYDFMINTYDNDNEKFKKIDQIMKKNDCTEIAFSLSLYLIHYYLNDPHPTIKEAATNIIQYIEQNQQTFDDEFNDEQNDEFYSKENLLFASLEQNESLFSIMLSNYITNTQNIENSTKKYKKLHENIYNLTDKKIETIYFIQEIYGIAFNTLTHIFYVNGDGNISQYEFIDKNISNFQPIVHNGNNYFLILTGNTINVWNPDKKVFDITFNIPLINSLLYLIYFDNRNLFTISDDGFLFKICLLSQRIIYQKKIPLQQKIISVAHFEHFILLGLNDGNLCILNIDNLDIKIISHNLKINKMIYQDNLLYILNENKRIEICNFEQFIQIDISNINDFQIMQDKSILCCIQNDIPIIYDKIGNITSTNLAKGDYVCNISHSNSSIVFGSSCGMVLITKY